MNKPPKSLVWKLQTMIFFFLGSSLGLSKSPKPFTAIFKPLKSTPDMPTRRYSLPIPDHRWKKGGILNKGVSHGIKKPKPKPNKAKEVRETLPKLYNLLKIYLT